MLGQPGRSIARHRSRASCGSPVSANTAMIRWYCGLDGPMDVEVVGILLKDLLRVASAEDQHSVGALLADRAYESFRMRVAVGAARRDLRDGDALAGEDRIKGGGELSVPVADQVGEVGGTVTSLPQQLPGLLSGPDSCGMGPDAEDVHGASPDLRCECGSP